MPSVQVGFYSGGKGLVSGNIFSGTLFPVGGVQLKLDASGIGPIFVGLPWPGQTAPPVSGNPMTFLSGGGESSGGLLDGYQMNTNDSYFIPKIRLVSGITTIRVNCPAASSGTRLFWEVN